jgi:catechol 2,3-dioxygenase-like lactoylglutathione lyase family enzyme
MSALATAQTISFIPSKDLARAKAFFTEKLGLRLVNENQYILTLAAGQGELRVQLVGEFTPASFTAGGWQVSDIVATVKALAAAGVKMELYPQFGFVQDELGIWDAPDGGRVAWFLDPDGNTLSLSQ